jgi:hypothetical protein
MGMVLQVSTGRLTMLRLKPHQRTEFSETLRDLANLTFAALVLGQFIGDDPISWRAVVSGFLMWVALVVFALVLPGNSYD